MRVLIACALVVILTACDRTVAGTERPTDVGCLTWSMRVTPASATLHPGDAVQASAVVNQCLSIPSSTTVRWRSSDTVTAVVDAVTGLVRARAPGPVTVIASVVADTTIRGAMALSVVPR